MQPHPRVLRYLGGLPERLSGKTPPTPQETKLMPIHSSLARACQARFQTRFRASARAPVPSLDDSSTMMLVLSQIQMRWTADANDIWVLQFERHLAVQ